MRTPMRTPRFVALLSGLPSVFLLVAVVSFGACAP